MFQLFWNFCIKNLISP